MSAITRWMWVLGCAALVAACATRSPKGGDGTRPAWRIVSLGCAQDAGYPHLGCFKSCCERARAGGRRESVAALAVESVDSGDWWLVDATPDLPAQIHGRGRMPKGILLTHAHIGHYTGLMYLGREGMGARGMPVFASRKMARFLTDNAPWSQLVALGNIRITEFDDGVPFELGSGMRVVPHAVPHRNEFADTHAFAFEDVLYVPDIDRWEDWRTEGTSTGEMRRPFDAWKTLVVDGTFFDGGELPGRNMKEIPHPTVVRTLELLADSRTTPTVWFTHLNHTNPLWDKGSSASSRLAAEGCRVAYAGLELWRTPHE